MHKLQNGILKVTVVGWFCLGAEGGREGLFVAAVVFFGQVLVQLLTTSLGGVVVYLLSNN